MCGWLASALRRQAFESSSIEPALSLSWSLYIEASRPGLRTLLAKDGVIYKEAMAIVAEDVKKIMAEEFYQVYMKANEECIIEKEKESPLALLRGPNLAPKRMPIDPLAEFIDLSVWTYAHEGFWCGTVYVCTRRRMCVYERWRSL